MLHNKIIQLDPQGIQGAGIHCDVASLLLSNSRLLRQLVENKITCLTPQMLQSSANPRHQHYVTQVIQKSLGLELLDLHSQYFYFLEL
ncbi:MAG: hypothetical protein ACHP65_02740 [Legionellales bacterium]